MKVNQKNAVYAAITSVLAEANMDFEDGMNISETMKDKTLRAQVNTILFHGFRNGEIELDVEYSDSDLKAYVSGLQSNWIRKDKRFNGNVQYAAKNPGSRAGSGDASLTNAKRLLATITPDDDRYTMVEAFIAERTAEIAATKASKVTVDFSALPESLRTKFQK